MAYKTLPPIETLRQRLMYDPDTGKLYWREMQNSSRGRGMFNTRYANKEAFTCLKDGYLNGKLEKNNFLAHRIIWAIYHGYEPKLEIDHINGNRSDNRIANLRQVTKAENAQNRKTRRTSKSGIDGVYWVQKIQKWRAVKYENKKARSLGVFENLNDAIQCRINYLKNSHFHKNHNAHWRSKMLCDG